MVSLKTADCRLSITKWRLAIARFGLANGHSAIPFDIPEVGSRQIVVFNLQSPVANLYEPLLLRPQRHDPARRGGRRGGRARPPRRFRQSLERPLLRPAGEGPARRGAVVGGRPHRRRACRGRLHERRDRVRQPGDSRRRGGARRDGTPSPHNEQHRARSRAQHRQGAVAPRVVGDAVAGGRLGSRLPCRPRDPRHGSDARWCR